MHTMKGILEFDLNDKDDIEAHLRCVKSLDMALALDDIWSYIGKIWNNSEDEDTIKIVEVYERVKEILEHRDAFPDRLVS
jgi:hypothetical protein